MPRFWPARSAPPIRRSSWPLAGLRQPERRDWSSCNVLKSISSAAATANNYCSICSNSWTIQQTSAGLTWTKDGKVVSNPNRPDGAPSRSMAVPGSREPAAGLCRIDAARCARRCSRWSGSRRCRRRAAAPGRAFFATFRSSTKANGARAAPHMWSTSSSISKHTDMDRVYFVDDHFLLQPKRIEAICKGVTDNNLTIQWGCEGRVDSVAQHLFPAMAKAHCRTRHVRHRERQPENSRSAQERANAGRSEPQR